MIDDTEGNEQEVQHGTLACDNSVNFSLGIDVDFSLLSFFGLLLDGNGCLLSVVEFLDKFLVFEDGCWVGFRKFAQQL